MFSNKWSDYYFIIKLISDFALDAIFNQNSKSRFLNSKIEL